MYRAIRGEGMKQFREHKKLESLRLSPLKKRILITKTVADTHESLARSGAFKRAFVATGTCLPYDHSADGEVALQGVCIDYKAICTQTAIEKHKSLIDILEAEKTAKILEAKRLADEKRLLQAQIFAPAIKQSKSLWPRMLPLIKLATEGILAAIARHVKSSYICAGSFPAHMFAKVRNELLEVDTNFRLVSNDIDIYYGTFDAGKVDRIDCTYAQIQGIDKEVNLLKCSNLNLESMMSNCDINAVAICVMVVVEKSVVTATDWIVSPEFWHFWLISRTLQSWRTDSPARTLVRLAYKSYQMKLPFSFSSLSLLDGVLFTSHQKKILEMKAKWPEYPFCDFKLRAKSKKSFVFEQMRTECECGRKANKKCAFSKCSKCCSKESTNCKVHSK